MHADPVGLNRLLGTYTNFVNLLDYAALSVPSFAARRWPPFGVPWSVPAAATGNWPSSASASTSSPA